MKESLKKIAKKFCKQLKSIAVAALAICFPRSEAGDIWKWKNFLGAIAICSCVSLVGSASEPITDDQLHLCFVDGLNLGEYTKRTAIDNASTKLDRLKLYGLSESEKEVINIPRKAEGDAEKPKSKAMLAKEAREKLKLEKRQKLEEEKLKAKKIEELEAEIKRLSEAPAKWSKPKMLPNDAKFGQIGYFLYKQGDMTSPPFAYGNTSGNSAVMIGSAEDIRSTIAHQMRTSLAGSPFYFHVVSVIDDQSVLADFAEQTVCICGIDATKLVDGQELTIESPVVTEKPTKYTAVSGAVKSVKTFRKLTESETDRLNEYVRKHLSSDLATSNQ